MTENVDIGVKIQIQTPGLTEAISGFQVLTQQLEKLGVQFEDAGTSTMGYAEATAYNKAQLEEQLGIIEDTSKGLNKHKRYTDDATKAYEAFRYQSRALQSNIGLFGTIMRNVTSQLYWTGIGVMFVGMSMMRAQRQAISAQEKTLSLATAYKTLARASDNLTEATIIYGKGSREYQEAVGSQIEASEKLRLAKEQMVYALKQEYMANAQMWIGMFPVAINAFRMGYDMYVMWNTVRQHGIMLTFQEQNTLAGKTALQKMANLEQGKSNTLKGVSFATTLKLMIASEAEAVALVGEANATRASAYAHALRNAMITGGITAITSIIAAFGIQALAEADATSKMADLNAEAQRLGTTFNRATGASADFSNELSGESVDSSAESARVEIEKLNIALSKMPTASEMEVTYNIDTDTLTPAPFILDIVPDTRPVILDSEELTLNPVINEIDIRRAIPILASTMNEFLNTLELETLEIPIEIVLTNKEEIDRLEKTSLFESSLLDTLVKLKTLDVNLNLEDNLIIREEIPEITVTLGDSLNRLATATTTIDQSNYFSLYFTFPNMQVRDETDAKKIPDLVYSSMMNELNNVGVKFV